ncbi:MAG TPA: hypothetical protein VGD62_05885 [Acidobacteriaceae bacterium]
MGILGSYIFWKYERGSLHYDVMVSLILAFIFISPHLINYRDHPVAGNLSPTQVLVRPTSQGLVYEIPADQVHAGVGLLAGQLAEPLAEAIAPISGPVKVDRYEALKDASGKVTAYKVWAHR